LLQIDFLLRSSAVPILSTYSRTLAVAREIIEHVAVLPHQHRSQLGTRRGRRPLGCFDQSVMFCRWLLDRPRMFSLACDHGVCVKAAYRDINEALDVVAAQAPSLSGALPGCPGHGYPYVVIDGTLIATDRCSAPGPTKRVDVWWSGEHHRHGGNVQIITAPDNPSGFHKCASAASTTSPAPAPMRACRRRWMPSLTVLSCRVSPWPT